MPKHHVCPFKIVVDSNEQMAYRFNSIRDSEDVPVLIRTVRKPLWRMERRQYQVKTGEHIMVGLADYSIEDHEADIQVERKSVSDLVGSLTATRARMEARYARLNDCKRAYLLVEGGWSEVLAHCEAHDKKYGRKGTSKVVFRTYVAWSLRWPNVQWCMLPGRPTAEEACFRVLLAFFREYVNPSCPRY